ncbi:hypothetical protein PCANC_28882, partial [Puccinia coronata f. sp. avenae]
MCTPTIGVQACQTGVQSLHACLEGLREPQYPYKGTCTLIRVLWYPYKGTCIRVPKYPYKGLLPGS